MADYTIEQQKALALAAARKRKALAIKQPKEPQSIARTALDQGLQGATFGFADEAMDAIGALGAGSIMKAFRPDLMEGQDLTSLYNEARGMSKERLQQQKEQNPVTAYGSEIAAGLGSTIAAGVPKIIYGTVAKNPGVLGKAINAIPEAGAAINTWAGRGNTLQKAAKYSGVGVPSAALYGAGTADDGKAFEGAIEAAPYGLAAVAVPLVTDGARAVSNTASKALPSIEEGMVPVVELAQKYKIPVALSQVTSSNAVKNAQKVSSQLPLSGENAFRETQMKAFNRELIKTTGGIANKFTPELMDNLFTKVGKEFDDFGKGKVVNLNDQFAKATEDLVMELKEIAPEAVEPAMMRIQKIYGAADNTGHITGEKLAALRKETNRLARKTGNPDIASAFQDIENVLIDSLTVGDEAAAKAFSKTKQKYKNLLVIEPLAQKAKGGNISPALLQNRVSKIYGRQFTRGQAGEIGDLARIGNEILPEIGGSDTTQKLIYAGGLGGFLTNPALAIANAGKVATVLGGNRAIQSGINRNQNLVAAAAKRSKPLEITIRPSDRLPYPEVNLP